MNCVFVFSISWEKKVNFYPSFYVYKAHDTKASCTWIPRLQPCCRFQSFNLKLNPVSRVKLCQDAMLYLNEGVNYNSNQDFVEVGIGLNNEIISVDEGVDSHPVTASKLSSWCICSDEIWWELALILSLALSRHGYLPKSKKLVSFFSSSRHTELLWIPRHVDQVEWHENNRGLRSFVWSQYTSGVWNTKGQTDCLSEPVPLLQHRVLADHFCTNRYMYIIASTSVEGWIQWIN